MRRASLVMGAAMLFGEILVAGDLPGTEGRCGSSFSGVSVTTRPLDDIGGKHITARGTLRVLIVFASFPDDTTYHPYWPLHAPPLFMQDFIDPDTTVHSQGRFNLTNYFSRMSLGQFHLVGDVVWAETRHSWQEYLNGAYWKANQHVLEEKIDSLVDFSRYDNWTKQSDYHQVEAPDGQVDMIIMVWRTSLFQFFGEASLGYHAGFVLDGKRIEMGFPEYLPFPLGSGVTCLYQYNDSPLLIMQTMVHELSHWLLGGPHPYNSESPQGKHNYWGMLCNGLRTSSCVNAYEREKLGWTTVPDIPADIDVSLPDYLETGVAYKYHPPNGDPFEFFYFENHQQRSAFDDVTVNPDDRGLWVLHQQGPYMEFDNLRIVPSDGVWNWANPGSTSLCFSRTLPVFRKGTPNLPLGVSHRDQIPTPTSLVNWIYVYKDSSVQPLCGSFCAGEYFAGAFRYDGKPVFSPYSNPATTTWSGQPTAFSLEVVGESNGVVTVRYNTNPLDASPAQRYLGRDPSVSGSPPGSIALAWGSQWNSGQPLEADVNASELQRITGSEASWQTVYQGAMTAWADASVQYDSSGTVPVLFRVRVRDTQGKYSSWSNVFRTAMIPQTEVAAEGGEVPGHFELRANYPNPFNPTTTFRFALPRPETVSLTIYDILGRKVRVVLEQVPLSAGRHDVVFAAKDLAGGIYFYRLSTRNFVQTRKMCLLR